jgi:hypothetical protein
VTLQVVSFGPLGILAQSGWYCSEADEERWNGIAGWRRLQLPEVSAYFNHTFYAASESWGEVEERMRFLGLNSSYKVQFLNSSYRVQFMNDTWDAVLDERLGAGVPTLFYLWSPHPLKAKYPLSRIQLPPNNPECRNGSALQRACDYPPDIVEKLASSKFATGVPGNISRLYANFIIDNYEQENMLYAAESKNSTMFDVACAWLKGNEPKWQNWLRVVCEAGHLTQYNDTKDGQREVTCKPCPQGSASSDGVSCKDCPPGIGIQHAASCQPC